MNKWVECLCQVCGLKPEDVPDVDPPPPQPLENRYTTTAEVRAQQPLGITTQMGAEEPPPTPTGMGDQNSAGSYVRLDDCVSNKNEGTEVDSTDYDRRSVNSIPETPPPPIPLPIDPSPSMESSFSFEAEDLYKVPPRRDVPVSANDWYDVPPVHAVLPYNQDNMRRDSSSSSARRDQSLRSSTQSTMSEQSSLSGPNDVYDVPPTRYQLDEVAKKTSDMTVNDDVYDIPPQPILTNSAAPAVPDAPPRRPPRPSPRPPAAAPDSRLMYANVPPNSKVHQKQDIIHCKQRSLDEVYDYPKPLTGNGALLMSPPPPSAGNIQAHNYINTSSGVAKDDMYVPMADNSNNNTKIGNEMYTHMVHPPNQNGDLQALRDSVANENIYQIPPSNAPILSTRIPLPASRGTPPKKTVTKGGLPEDTYAIFPTARTRSFKKERVPTPPQTRSIIQPAISETIVVPTRTNSDTSSSSDDDDDSLSERTFTRGTNRSNANSMTLPANLKQPKQKGEIQYLNLDLSRPKPSDGEIQYLDLDLQSTPEKKLTKRSPKLSKPIPVGNVSPTEYKEIDFLKTNALIETRKTLESEHKRKNSDAISLL